MSEDFDLLFKVVLIGDCAVGKSWFVLITCKLHVSLLHSSMLK